MRKYLPRSTQGFTLVELLIVVSIIAILSVVGFAVFSGIQKGARDSRRQADIKAISDVFEANFSEATQAYAALSASQFSSGSIPSDPATTDRNYCVYSSTSAQTSSLSIPITGWTPSVCPAASNPTGTVVAAPAAAGIPAATSTWWRVCALMDDKATTYCLSNRR